MRWKLCWKIGFWRQPFRESEANDQVEGIGVWVEQIMLCEAGFELGSSQILGGSDYCDHEQVEPNTELE